MPRAGGGLYKAEKGDPNVDNDHRCWNMRGGMCFNDEEKDIISKILVDDLVRMSFVTSENRTSALLSISSNKKLKALIEFSRAVHAEMHAIINSGKNNKHDMSDTKLFVTTYPCHLCARHLVAAGVKEVYYIEPYRKSLATKLHNDAITEDESETLKMRILPYDGVAPSRYLRLFRVPSNTRKSCGKLVKVNSKTAHPRFDKTLEALPTLEGLVVKGLKEKRLIQSGGNDEA